ncbi:hypothetical protein L596_020096 [Steinernema carpocapsae]|uniref:Uncharacterized protein n=1 Tax=Steinernema carpocapsae TaxID=34508 RepID=A0A4U5MSN1_STECR|nr:hypothetical protein L596_020096 [Steinernema carpocapsae]
MRGCVVGTCEEINNARWVGSVTRGICDSVLPPKRGIEEGVKRIEGAKSIRADSIDLCLVAQAFCSIIPQIAKSSGGLNVLRPESRKVGLAPFDRLLGAVGTGPVLL